MNNHWERLRYATLDQVVTTVKLTGSAAQINGATTPEGWPFLVVVAVARPGNERAVEFAKEFFDKMVAAARWTEQASNPDAGKAKP